MTDRVFETFGQRLRKCRNNKNMTKEQVAEALGVTQDYYGKIENDKLMLSYDILEQLYRMEWDIGYIITGCELGQEESLWLMKDIMDVEFDKNQQSLRFWLYVMESQINKGVLQTIIFLWCAETYVLYSGGFFDGDG